MSDSDYRLEDDLYKPVSPAEPCGPNLQRDEAFFEVRSLSTPKPGRYDPINNVDLPPQPPEWSKVLGAARGFLKKSRDATVLLSLVKAELSEGGLPAFAGALHCLRWHLTTFWEDVHPQADEDGDYWERVTALRGLADPTTLARPVEEAVLHRSPMAGPVTLRTLAIAQGNATARPGELALTEAALEELIAEENVAPKLKAAHDAADAAAELLQDICTFVSGQEGSEPLAAKEPLEALQKVKAMLQPWLAEPEAPAAEAGEDAPAGEAPAEETVVVRRHAPGDIRTREEAQEVIRAVMTYYAANGRSSPVPLVLARLQELMELSFAEVLEQIAPAKWEDAALPLAGLKSDKVAPKGAAPAPAAAPKGPDPAVLAAAGARADSALGAIEQTLRDGFIPSTEQTGEMRAAIEALKAAATPPAAEAAPAPAPGSIESPADVRSAIDRLVKHFETTDPNSVVPAFLRRAKPLVDRHFPDILKELAPEGAGGAKLLLQPRKV